MPPHLNFPSPNSLIFRRRSVPKSLGPIWKVQVWHDNSGSSPSWFLSRILVKDLSTRSCTIFVADKWFAVEEDDGKVEREILAADAPLPTNVIFKAKGRVREGRKVVVVVVVVV